MNKCIICDEDSGFSMICDDCKTALKYYKLSYFAKKKMKETTELDEVVFEQLCKEIQLDDAIKELQNGIFSATVDECVEEINDVIKEYLQNNTWLSGQPGRFDNFLKYVEKEIRKAYE